MPIVAGLVAGLLVTGVLAFRDLSAQKARGAQLAAELQRGGSDAALYLTMRGNAARQHLEFIGDKHAREVAESAARMHLANNYGLTPARLQKLQRLQQRFG